MQFHWSYIGCDKSDAEEIAALWRGRQEEVTSKAAAVGQNQTDQLRVLVERADEAPTWRMQAALYVAPSLMTAEVEHDNLADALDELVNSLSQNMDEWLDQSTDAEVDRGKLDGVVPLLQGCYRRRSSEAFFAFLMPAIHSLRRYAQRELRTRRLLGELPAEQVTLRDVLDEVMLQAWNQFERRSSGLPLDLWLVQLVDDTIEAACRRIADESLDDRRPEPAEELHPPLPGEDEWVEQPTQLESVDLARLLPGEPGIEMWDDLDVEVKQARLDEIFEQMSRSQRQVLMLYAVEGFNIATIADFQDRSVAEVEQDLAAARTVLQRIARAQELPEIEERLERSALKRSRRAHRT